MGGGASTPTSRQSKSRSGLYPGGDGGDARRTSKTSIGSREVPSVPAAKNFYGSALPAANGVRDIRSTIPNISADTPSVPPAITKEMLHERFKPKIDNKGKEAIVIQWVAHSPESPQKYCDPLEVHEESVSKVIEIQNEKFRRRLQRKRDAKNYR
ncbi:hypothetical protein ADEAN_000723800 [Angomonas deanei]|uniref:Uncharacterized protein n=1 Tax=Angomonas deanei TaxID=59799 RepID=A0A7G2CK04_9TRYP|nr:hypothetical protein ADEAN_000723800 [Angomonas deanei]